ncbi:MAG: CHASE domain-containing protein [Dehalococcoidia bacterium]|jgi:signal transduction histidine kinase|nr:CHASE domain-containing protein [Dehalococcoidia bacterium]
MEIPAPETGASSPVKRDFPRRVDRGRLPYFIAGATLTILLAMTIGTVIMVRSIVDTQSGDRFEAFSARAPNTIAAELRAVMAEADEIAGVLVGSPDVTADAFSEFAGGLRDQNVTANTIGFIPLVQTGEADDFEASMRSQGFTAYLMESGAPGGEQFPVAFIDPPDGIPARFGDDLGQDPAFAEAMIEARDTGRAAATAPFIHDGSTSFAVLAPIYRSGVRVQSTDQRRDALIGFGLTLYNNEQLMAGPIARADLSEVHTTITDLGPISTPNEIAVSLFTSPAATKDGGSHAVTVIEVGGRDWRFDLRSVPWFGVSALERNVWMIALGAGLAITAIATGASYSLASSRQSARSDLRLMSTQLSVFLESALEGILLVDRDRRVVWTNQAFANAFGYRDSAALVGLTSPELEQGAEVSVQEPAGLVGRIDEIYTDENLTVPAEDINFVEPSPVTYSRTSVPVTDEDGDYRGRLWVYRDVTGERAAEQAKGVFVSMVSHELRTPLTSVIGFLELVISGAAGPITSESERLLGMARRSSDRLKRLVNDILDISRLEGGIRVDLAPDPLVPLVSELLDNVRGEFESRNLTLQVNVPPGLPEVYADSSRLFQVLMNLTTNAYRYTPEGGKVTLAAQTRGDLIEISVTDTGVGIPDEDKERIFERFVRVESEARKSPGSTGLGLAIAKSLTELQGGVIEMTSDVGVGTTFRVLLNQAPDEKSSRTINLAA